MGLGFLAKGPVALLLPGLLLAAAGLALPRAGRPSWGALGRAFAAAALLAVAVASPWFLWMGARHGSAFWVEVLGQLGHYADPAFEHSRRSLLYFVPVLLVGFFPWVVLLPPALRGLRRSDPSPAGRFRLLMALAAGTSFLFWSLSTSQLPGYGLVFLPPLAALLGCRLAEPEAADPPRPRIPLVVLALLVLAAAVLPQAFPAGGERPADGPANEALRRCLGLALPAGLLLFLLLAGASLAKSPRVPVAAVALAGVLPVLLAVPAAVPATEALLPFREASRRLLAEEAGRPPAALAVYRRRLPSLTFYTGRSVSWPGTPEEMEDFLRAPGERRALVRESHLSRLAAGTWRPVRSYGSWVLIRPAR